MEGDLIKVNHWLTPFSWLYGLGVSFRNWMFDAGILKEKSFDIPTISVGNLTVGGCGKTPHVEYLVALLKDKYKVAVLSRGYKRKSHGYKLAEVTTPMPQTGDEPFQMKRKFPDIYVAVDKSRRHGIRHLTKDKKSDDVEVILLDDAYQHRYVKPGLNILLVDYHRIITFDKLLPAGRLREPIASKERADIVIVTKLPDTMKPIDYRVLEKILALRPYQKLYFTSIIYKSLVSFRDNTTVKLDEMTEGTSVLLFTGIASPEQIKADMQQHCHQVTTLAFPDHHQYTKADINKIGRKYDALPKPCVIITTEKDAARLSHLEDIPANIKDNLYVLPIEIGFRHNTQTGFDNTILSYLRTKNYHPKSDTKTR